MERENKLRVGYVHSVKTLILVFVAMLFIKALISMELLGTTIHDVQPQYYQATIYQKNRTDTTTTPCTILVWANARLRRIRFRPNFDNREACRYRNCKITYDKSQLNTSDAVVIFMRDGNSNKIIPPPIHYPWQTWIMFNHESPVNSKNNYTRFNGMFNATMTFRFDSDIHIPYGYVEDNGANTKGLKYVSNFTRGKTKHVAWFVSNCRTQSKRENYVKALQKHIKVDIFGSCGKYSCKDINECYNKLERNYKFYLSFENSLCIDYVTEKAFAVLQRDVIPVVLGGADYSKIMPPGSYIDVKDYASPKDLVDYLLELDKNDTLYESFFQWKLSYAIKGTRHSELYCRLCEFMNTKLHYRQRSIDRIDSYMNVSSKCMSSKVYYQNISLS